jgi:hypothetical protein
MANRLLAHGTRYWSALARPVVGFLAEPRVRRLAPLLTLLVLGSVLLFYNYGSGAFQRWDESLYG